MNLPRGAAATTRAGPESLGYSRFKWLLVALAVGLSVAFFAFFMFSAKQNVDQAQRNAERQMANLAALLADQALQAFSGVRLSLATAAAEIAGETNPERLNRILQRYAAIDGRLQRVTLLDAEGRPIASGGTLEPGANFTERDFWKSLTARERPSEAIGVPRRDPASDKWVVSLARAIRDPDGTWHGALVADLPRDFFEKLYSQIDTGWHSSFGILDRRGAVVARTVGVERVPDNAVAGSNFFEAAMRTAQRDDSAVHLIGLDGVERIYAFSTAQGLPYVVFAGTSPEDYLAAWRENIRISLPFSALVVAIFIFLILALARHLGRLEESEASIRQSDARYQTLVANIPGIVFQRRRDGDGRNAIVWISEAIVTQLGISVEACLRENGRPLARATDPDDLALLMEAYDRSAANMIGVHWVGRMHHSDGRRRWFELTARPRRSNDGGIIWEGIALDVTDRLVAEHALENVRAQLDAKKAQLETALSNMAQGMCVYDDDLRLVVFNQRYLELYGLENAGIREGSTLEDTMRASISRGNYAIERAEAIVQERLAAARQHQAHRLIQRLENGRVIEVDVRPLAGGGSVASFTEITERENAGIALRQAKETAELADRAKSQFLANMSHELRTPLNAIIGFAEIMTDKLFGPLGDPRYDEYAMDIRESGRHLLMLINDILDLSKIEARQANLREEQVDIGEIFAACARLVGERAQRGSLDLDVHPADGIPAVWADRIKLKQILLNLLSNAIKFTPAGGKVTMGAIRRPDGAIEIAVADTGIGMRAQDIPIALQPFRQIESTLARRHEGTGLGLPLTKAIVEMHGGKLDLQSTPGKGTTVTVIFPAERVIDPHGVQDAQLAEAIHAARNAL